MGTLLEDLSAALAPGGFNLIGVALPPDYDRRVKPERRLASRCPDVRSVVVIGNGGGAMWEAFRRRCRREAGFVERADPLDDFTIETIQEKVAGVFLPRRAGCRIVYPFRFREDPISFMDLAVAAGLGSPSILGVLLHPQYGPWMALRAAVLTDTLLAAPRPAESFDPCPSCAQRPCAAACPARVVRFPEGWDIPGCIDHRLRTGDCGDRCQARAACVYGPKHRYPDDETAYHQRRSWEQMRRGRPQTISTQ